ncbi:MAG TPA: hypothetical protein P5307_02090 [Pirellulaceae bacterium]|nr:hypothetical protein [Planctomycetales bacterium]MCB9939836.1 hypothetical protein [Planctomycetaceae bacterium]HRX77818.1 hypothetical protein [Pirellulaceae bacterium]
MSNDLKPTHWYWVRRDDGSIAPYRFHQAKTDAKGRQLGEFFVGSFIRTFPLSAVVGEAEMPSRSP